MKNNVVVALLILAAVALLLIFNRGNVTIDMYFTSISLIKSLAFLIFTALGVVVGLLLKG